MKPPVQHKFKRETQVFSYQVGYFSLLKVNFIMLTCHDTLQFPTDLSSFYTFSKMPDVPENIKLVNGIFFPSYPISKKLPKLSLHAGKICYVRTQYRRFFTDLSGSFLNYEKKFSGKAKANLMKTIRKFKELSGGKINWQVYRTPAELRVFCNFAKQLSLKTYQEKLLHVGFPKSKSFENRVCKLAAEDKVRGYLLFHNEKPISYVFCPCIDDIVIYQYVGYDPEFRMYSVGTILQYLLLQSLFEEKKFRLFDYTQGEGQHKEFFSTGAINCADIYFFNITVRNVVLIGLHSFLSSASSLFVVFLKKTKLHHYVKKIVRFGC